MARKTTARDVASAAGVSASTVDRVLNGRGGVDPDKERRVIEWARKLKLDRSLDQRMARTLRIAALIQPPQNPFHAAIQASLEAANRVYADLNMQFRVFHFDPNHPKRTACMIAELSGAHDGLIVCCPQSEEIAAALRRFGEHKPVMTLATDIRDSGRLAYVGPDNRKAGRVAGDLMGRFLRPEGGDVIMIAGLLSMIGHEEREAGFRSVLRERYPECRVLEVLESQEQSERAGDLVFDALKRNPSVRGIYNASAGARTVVDAMRATGRQNEIVFITHELTEDRRVLLRDGLIDAIIDQNPEFEVRTAIEAMAQHFGRIEAATMSTITPIYIHMIENC